MILLGFRGTLEQEIIFIVSNRCQIRKIYFLGSVAEWFKALVINYPAASSGVFRAKAKEHPKGRGIKPRWRDAAPKARGAVGSSVTLVENQYPIC